MKGILLYIDMKITMLGVALGKATLDKDHLCALLSNIEDAIKVIRKEINVEKSKYS